MQSIRGGSAAGFMSFIEGQVPWCHSIAVSSQDLIAALRVQQCWKQSPVLCDPFGMAIEVPWVHIQSHLRGFSCCHTETKFALWLLRMTFIPLKRLQQSVWNYFLSLNHQSSCEGLCLCWPEPDNIVFNLVHSAGLQHPVTHHLLPTFVDHTAFPHILICFKFHRCWLFPLARS